MEAVSAFNSTIRMVSLAPDLQRPSVRIAIATYHDRVRWKRSLSNSGDSKLAAVFPQRGGLHEKGASGSVSTGSLDGIQLVILASTAECPYAFRLRRGCIQSYVGAILGTRILWTPYLYRRYTSAIKSFRSRCHIRTIANTCCAVPCVWSLREGQVSPSCLLHWS